MSNALDPDQDRHFVSPDLGTNYLQRLSADGGEAVASKERVNVLETERSAADYGKINEI